MSNRLFVKPGVPTPPKGSKETPQPFKVRKPSGGYLADEGEFVPDESFWRRRMADGDVVEATPPAEKPAAGAKAS